MPHQPHISSEHRHTHMRVYTPELGGGPYPGTPITVIRRGRPLGCHWQQQMERHLTLSSNKVETCTFYSNVDRLPGAALVLLLRSQAGQGCPRSLGFRHQAPPWVTSHLQPFQGTHSSPAQSPPIPL